jgi:hypothetical protein
MNEFGSNVPAWKNYEMMALTQETTRYSGMGNQVLVNVFPVCGLRELGSFYYPMLYTGDTTLNNKGSRALEVTSHRLQKNWNFIQSSLSRSINWFYMSNHGTISKRIVNATTEQSLFGDIYPLSSMDHGGTINPYNTDLVKGHKYYTARVRNSIPLEQVVYDKYPSLGKLRIEINKCIPNTYHCHVKDKTVVGLSLYDSLYRIYSAPKTDGCKIRLADENLYIPSRYVDWFGIFKPKLSRHNIFFLTDKGASRAEYTHQAWVPKYTNMDGVEGYNYPKAESFYTPSGIYKTATTHLASNSYSLPDDTKYVSGLAPTVLLNPYIPVKKSGDGNVIVPTWNSSSVDDRKWWYEKCVRGRIRCMAQTRMAGMDRQTGIFGKK